MRDVLADGCQQWLSPKSEEAALLEHSTRCDACGLLLRQATEDFAAETMEGELRTLARSQWSSKNAWNLLREGLGWNKPIAPGQGTLRPIRINHKDGKHGSGVFALREPAIEAMSCGCGASRTSLG
jgi:hypothetical protein